LAGNWVVSSLFDCWRKMRECLTTRFMVEYEYQEKKEGNLLAELHSLQNLYSILSIWVHKIFVVCEYQLRRRSRLKLMLFFITAIRSKVLICQLWCRSVKLSICWPFYLFPCAKFLHQIRRDHNWKTVWCWAAKYTNWMATQ
jgi:hypothetical protein